MWPQSWSAALILLIFGVEFGVGFKTAFRFFKPLLKPLFEAEVEFGVDFGPRKRFRPQKLDFGPRNRFRPLLKGPGVLLKDPGVLLKGVEVDFGAEIEFLVPKSISGAEIDPEFDLGLEKWF